MNHGSIDGGRRRARPVDHDGAVWSWRVVAAALAALALVLGLQLPALAQPTSQDAEDRAQISLSSVTPVFPGPDDATVVTGRVRNTGDAPIAKPVVRLRVASSTLRTRDHVSSWVAGDGGKATREVGKVDLPEPLAAQASAPFRITIPEGKLSTEAERSNLAAGLSLADGETPSAVLGRLATPIPWTGSGLGEIKPLSMSWVVPLTLPPDPDLFSATGRDRLAAWRRAIGPGSRVDSLLRELRDEPVTWLLDPSMLEPPISPTKELPAADATAEGRPDRILEPTPEPTTPSPEPSTSSTAPPSGSPSSEPSASPTPTTPSPTSTQEPEPAPDDTSVATLVADLRQRLVNRGDNQPVWWLPYADPDLLALHSTREPGALERNLTRTLSPASKAMGSTTVNWPAGAITSGQLTAINSAWRKARTESTPPTLLPRNQLAEEDPNLGTGSVAHRLDDGTPVLTYDERLSAWARASEEDTRGIGTRVQAFLADSLAAHLQRPSATRRLMVATPRLHEADPEVIARLVRASAEVPWLQGAAATAEVRAVATAPRSATVQRPSPTPKTPPSPVTTETLNRVAADRRLLGDLQSILVESDDVIEGWNAAHTELTSVRWRGESPAHADTAKRLHTTLEQVPQQVAVRPGSINFFTDEGEIGVTVVNGLRRPLRDVRLVLEPRLAILVVDEQPEPLTLRANSRATVRVPIRALSSGQVNVDAQLSTPTGLTMGNSDAPTRLEFTVRPTGSWLYWVLGAVAGPTLVIGLIRSVRSRRRDQELTPAADHPPSDGTDADPARE